MVTPRTKTLIATVILLVLLALVSGTSAAINLLGVNRAQALGANGALQGTPGPGRNFQGGPGNGNTNNGNFQNGNGRFQGRGGGAFGGGMLRALGLDFQMMGYLNLGIAALGIILLLVAAAGIWAQKRWALYLSVVIAALFLLGALPGLFFGAGRFTLLRTGLDVLSAGSTLAALVLALWPSTRSAVS